MIINRREKRNGIDDDPCVINILGEPSSKANSRRFVLIDGKSRLIKSKCILEILICNAELDKRCLKKILV